MDSRKLSAAERAVLAQSMLTTQNNPAQYLQYGDGYAYQRPHLFPRYDANSGWIAPAWIDSLRAALNAPGDAAMGKPADGFNFAVNSIGLAGASRLMRK